MISVSVDGLCGIWLGRMINWNVEKSWKNLRESLWGNRGKVGWKSHEDMSRDDFSWKTGGFTQVLQKFSGEFYTENIGVSSLEKRGFYTVSTKLIITTINNILKGRLLWK